MNNTSRVQLQRGVLTLPSELRNRYNWQPGVEFTVIDMDGALLLTPGRSEIDYLAEQVHDALVARWRIPGKYADRLVEERAVWSASAACFLTQVRSLPAFGLPRAAVAPCSNWVRRDNFS